MGKRRWGWGGGEHRYAVSQIAVCRFLVSLTSRDLPLSFLLTGQTGKFRLRLRLRASRASRPFSSQACFRSARALSLAFESERIGRGCKSAN
jgi:hypothetical protein